jgi:hypothetical protein
VSGQRGDAVERVRVGQALAYAAAGWRPFPTQPNRPDCPEPGRCLCKAPVIPAAHGPGSTCRGECGRHGHGFWDATSDPAVIRRWWDRWPDANVAIATGAPGPDVLDVDDHGDAGNGFAALNRVKRAGLLTGAQALVRTPSGGLHVYFAGSAQPCGRLPRHHLDAKCSGGYVLAPGSAVHGRPYELVDHRPGTAGLDWPAVRRLLDPPPAHGPSSAGTPGTLTPRAREGIRQAVAESNANGGWAGVLFWSGCRYGERGAPLDEALADLLPAAEPWSSHEERRAVMHITNGWHRAAGEARGAAG